MKKRFIIVLAFLAFLLVMYLCKDWMFANVPDHDYSDRVVHNKQIFIGIIALVGFAVLLSYKKYKDE